MLRKVQFEAKQQFMKVNPYKMEDHRSMRKVKKKGNQQKTITYEPMGPYASVAKDVNRSVPG